MSIFKRHGSTVIDRLNLTVLDVTELTDPQPVPYTPDNFFAFYDYVFKVDVNLPDFDTSAGYSFLLNIVTYLEVSTDKNELELLGGFLQIRSSLPHLL